MSVQVESPLYPSWAGLIRPSTRGVNGAQGLDLRLITHRVRRVGQARVGMGPILDQRSVSDMDSNHLVQEILDFWFGSPDSAELGRRPKVWFQATLEFDQDITQTFSESTRPPSPRPLDHLPP